MQKLVVIIILFSFPASFVFFPRPLSASASINVPISSGVYRAIDRLAAAELVNSAVTGQRPYSRAEVARILLEAEANFGRLTNPADKMMAFRILRHWKEEYATESKRSWNARALDRIEFDYKYLSGPDREIFNNGTGGVAAHVRPLTEFRDGRHFEQGTNYSFETYHYLAGHHVALFAHPRFQFQINSGSRTEEDKVFVQELYGKIAHRDFEFEIGRDAVIWGTGEDGGLMFSDNARPLDLIKLSSPHPFRLPWACERLGDIRAAIFVANMGPSYSYKYAYLTAWRVDIQPVSSVELGFNYGFLMGGSGSPAVTAGSVARNFFGFIPRVSDGAGSDRGGADIRVRIPPAWNMEAYAEIYLEDPDLSAPSALFKYRTAYLGGIYLPRLGGSNNMAIRAEYRHASPHIYRNARWASGTAESNELMGDPLGPDADGFYAGYYYDLGMASRLILRGAYERRYGDVYVPSGDGFAKTAESPTETRLRTVFQLEHPIKTVWVKWFCGYESLSNFNFTAGNDHNSVFAGFNLGIDLNI